MAMNGAEKSFCVNPVRRLGGREFAFAGGAAISMVMTDTILDGPDCSTMAEVRAGVDHVDGELVALLARRFGYMDAAARIKPERAAVRDEARKDQVIANVRRHARAAGIPEQPIAQLWDRLVEASIAYEFDRFDERCR